MAALRHEVTGTARPVAALLPLEPRYEASYGAVKQAAVGWKAG